MSVSSVRAFRRQYGLMATAHEFARIMTKFPDTSLLGKSTDPMLYIKHYMGVPLRRSRLLKDKLTPEATWANIGERQRFFAHQLEKRDTISGADLFKAADNFFNYVPIVPPSIIDAAVTKLKPQRILDISANWGSAIVALAMSSYKATLYEGLCANPTLITGLQMLRTYLTNDDFFRNRITIVPSAIDYFIPAVKYDMVIVDVRTNNSEHIVGEPLVDSLSDDAYMQSRIMPMLKKAKSALAGTMLLIMSTSNPRATEIIDAAKSLGLRVDQSSVVGSFNVTYLKA